MHSHFYLVPRRYNRQVRANLSTACPQIKAPYIFRRFALYTSRSTHLCARGQVPISQGLHVSSFLPSRLSFTYPRLFTFPSHLPFYFSLSYILPSCLLTCLDLFCRSTVLPFSGLQFFSVRSVGSKGAHDNIIVSGLDSRILTHLITFVLERW